MSTLPASINVLRLVDDHEELTSLPLRAQKALLDKLDWVDRYLKASHGSKSTIAAKAAEDLDLVPGSFLRYVNKFLRGGWRGLKDTRAKGNGGTRGLPPQFESWVKELYLRNQRTQTGREVHRIVIERWNKWRRSGEGKWAIPGYDAPPAVGPKGYPKGWSEDQIWRLRPDHYACATARQGAKAAADFLPSILKTRCGTRFGQVVFFDDQDYDTKVVAPGLSQRSLRPQGFNSIDYLSGCFLDHSIRMRWWDCEKNQYKTLTGIEATWFIIAHLQRHGYRSDTGTVLVVEHGTMNGYANMELSTPDGWHRLEDALKAVTDGMVTIARSGLFNHPAFAGLLFRPQSSGNPNFKSPLEGMFNLVRNRHAGLLGATGRNRDEAPAEQYGSDLYVKQLLKVWEKLDDRHRQHLVFPIPTAAQFGDSAFALYQAINARRDHEIEGWESCGFRVPLFRFTEESPWIGQADLARKIAASPQLAHAVDALALIPGHVTTENLAPIEVADLYRHELLKLPDHLVPLLIPVQWARRVTVNQQREIHIKDQMLGPEAMIFIARTENRDGAFILKPGTRLLAYLNPHLPEKLILCREDGSFLGTIHQNHRAGFMDTEAITAQLGMRAEMKADLDTAVRPALESLIDHRAEMKRTNDRLRDGKPVLPEEIADARSEAGRKAHRTAAANRLQDLGEATDYDTDYDTAPDPRQPTGPIDPFANLPDQ